MRHLIFGAALAATFSNAALAADPSSGTLTAANDEAHPLTYTANGSDSFALTIDLPRGYPEAHPQTYIRLLFSGDVAGESESVDTDAPTGDPLDPNGHWATGHVLRSGVDQVFLVASGRKRQMTVNNSGGNGTINVSIALVHLPDDPGNPDLPYAAHGIGPRFAKYTPKNFPGLGLDYSEPSMGYDPRTGAAFSINTLDVLRTTFDDSTTPAMDRWESRPPLTASRVTLDPILYVDQGTGRVFALNLAGPISTADYSDDDGVTWLPGGNGFPTSGVDHQTIGTGSYPASGVGALIPHPLYPEATYYCSQGIADAYCSRSDDGGINFDPARPIYTSRQCVGLHGQVKVGPDGTVYVPNKACNLSGIEFGNGNPSLLVSEDAGVTWSIRPVSDTVSSLLTSNDPSVAIGRDNTVYVGYYGLDGHLRVAVSQDRGQTWFNDFDVGAIAGVHSAKFPQAVAGDAGRAAVTFLGTRFPELNRTFSGSGLLKSETDQPDENMDFPGVWHAYIATTLDFGAHWFVSEVAPDDLIQGPKGIGGGGDNRNLLDFNGATIDAQGRVLAVFADGCVGGCSAGTQGMSSYFMRVAQMFRQTGGPRMYAQFDPVEPAVPPPPRLTGYRTQDYVVLQIDADNGGSPITGYNIDRNGTRIASNESATRFVDLTASDPTATYAYTATAINALGESAPGNRFIAVVDENAPVTAAVCTLPGQLHLDQIGEPGAETPESDVTSLGIAEPADQPGKLVFTVQMNAQGGSAKIAFDHPDGRRYTIQIDASGANVIANDGQWFANTQDELSNDLVALTDVPPLDGASANGSSFVVVLDKQAWGLNTGDVLGNVRVIAEQFGGNGRSFLRDYLGYDVNQPIVGNDFCAKGAHLPPPTVPAVTPAPAPQTADTKRFGGAIGSMTLLPLLLLGLLRRASRAA